MKKVGLSSSDLLVKKGYEDLLSPTRLQNHSALLTEFRRVEVLDEFFTKFNTVVRGNDNILREMGENEKRMANLLLQKAKILTRDNKSETDAAFADFLNKVAETNLTLSASHPKHSQEVVRQAAQPYNTFNTDLMKAKEQLENYLEIREFFLSSSAKVRSCNTASKKVVLSKLERLEESRDEFGQRFDRSDVEVRDTLKTIQDRSKCEIMDNVASTLEERLNYHRSIVTILEQVSFEIDRQKELVHQHRKEQELEQKRRDELKASTRQQSANYEPLLPQLLADPAAIKALCYKVQWPVRFDCFSDRDKLVITHHFDITSRSLTMSNGLQYAITDMTAGRSKKKCNQIKMRSVDGLEWNFTVKTPSEREKWMECYWLVKYGCERPVDVRTSTVPLAEPIKILVATWNMGDAPPKWLEDPIETWLPPGYDVYCISTQECNYNPRPGYANCQNDFFQWISDHLGSEYLKLAATNLLSIRLGVFLKRTHYYKVSNLRYATVATGIANIYGNKGGAGISFSLYDKSFCFVGTHLAARIDRGRLAVRNANYRDIISRMPFSNACSDIHNEFDYFFWTGDLNYRIEWDRDKIIHCADTGQFEELLKYDQLMQERTAGNCFFQFTEGAVNFKPTYRFDRGSRKWSDEKMREPAWCDRVLWKTPYPENVRQIAYLPAHGLMTSDHSPVYAGFVVNVPYPPFPHHRSNVHVHLTNIRGYDCLIEKEQKIPAMVFLSFQAPWLDPVAPSFSGPSIGTFPAPQWADTSIPPLVPLATTHEFLSRQWLRVVVRTKADPAKSSILGSGVIPLSIGCGSMPAPFSIFLTDRGVQSGVLSGDIFVNWIDNEYVFPSYANESLVSNSIAASPIFQKYATSALSPRSDNVPPTRPASNPIRPNAPPPPTAQATTPATQQPSPPLVHAGPVGGGPTSRGGAGPGGKPFQRIPSSNQLNQSVRGYGRGGGLAGQQGGQSRPKSASIPDTPNEIESAAPGGNGGQGGGRGGGGIHMQVQFGGGPRGGGRGGRGGEGSPRAASTSRGAGKPPGQGQVGQGQGQAMRPRLSLGESGRGARGGARGARGGVRGGGPGQAVKRPLSAPLGGDHLEEQILAPIELQPELEQSREQLIEQPQEQMAVELQPTQQLPPQPAVRRLPKIPQQVPYQPQPPQPIISGVDLVLGQVGDLLDWLAPTETEQTQTKDTCAQGQETNGNYSYEQNDGYNYGEYAYRYNQGVYEAEGHAHERQEGEGVVLGVVGSSSSEEEGDQEQALAALDAAFTSGAFDKNELAKEFTELDQLI